MVCSPRGQQVVHASRRGGCHHRCAGLARPALPEGEQSEAEGTGPDKGRTAGGKMSMGNASVSSSKRLLDPIDRVSEVLFGLIMALTFTCSMSAAEAGREDVPALLIGALGCNIAWGLIDAVIFLLVNLTERARGFAILKSLRVDERGVAARAIVADALPPFVAGALSSDDLDMIRGKLTQLSEPPGRPRLRRDDY